MHCFGGPQICAQCREEQDGMPVTKDSAIAAALSWLLDPSDNVRWTKDGSRKCRACERRHAQDQRDRKARAHG